MITYNIENLSLRYNEKRIADSLSWTIQAGEMWGILGPNGSGKSSLLHTLARLQSPQTGHLFITTSAYSRIALNKLSSKEIAKHIAILFQQTHFPFPQTVKDYCHAARFPHVACFAKTSATDQAIVQAALQCVCLNSYEHRRITTLSGGEKQRLAIASVLIQTPQLYLLDEPSNHLDIYFQTRVLTHFQQLAATQQAAVVMAMHDINLVERYCSHVLLLRGDGQTQQGRREDILTAQHLSALYQHPIHPSKTAHGRYWVAEKIYHPEQSEGAPQQQGDPSLRLG